MNPEAECRSEILAEGPCCKIERCSCGSLRVTIGFLMLRLEPAAFEVLAAIVAEARGRLVGRAELQPRRLC